MKNFLSRALVCAFLGVIFLLPNPASGQDSSAQLAPAAWLQSAMQQINSGAVSEGLEHLKALTTAHPDFVQGWNSLGIVERRNTNFEESLLAYQAAMELSPDNPRAMFNVGVAHALLDDFDASFEWLLKTKETGGFLVANIGASPAAAKISGDPRYAQLFPSDAEFSDSFVEGTRVIQDWYGEQAGDTFGWIARNIGDVDGDGINDITTSSPGAASAAGKIYVYSARSGELLWSATGKTAGGRLGHGIEAAGDVNGDGTPDVVAGAPYSNIVTVFSGIDGTELFSLNGGEAAGAFGLSVKGIGDVNDDGHSDILVGEPFQVWGGAINGGDLSQTGQIHIFSGIDQSILLTVEGEGAGHGFGSSISGSSHSNGFTFVVGAPGAGKAGTGKSYVYDTLTGDPQFVAEPDSGAAQYGSMFLSVVGDLNADGHQDVYISDWGDNTVGVGAGKVYLYSGLDGERLYALTGEAAGDGYGIGISDAGDVNLDGYDDLVVGAWQHASAALSGGKLYIQSGEDGSLLYTITGKVDGETLGFDTTGMGDVDGDGYPDFLITSAYSMKNGYQSGRTLILSGNPADSRVR